MPHILHLCVLSGSNFPLSAHPLSYLSLCFLLVSLPLLLSRSAGALERLHATMLNDFPAKGLESRDTGLAMALGPGPGGLVLVRWSVGREDES